MTDLEQLRANLEKAKQDLEAKGYKLGEKGEFMDLVPAMKQYEFRFQDAIEQVWPDKAWWQMTNYWDIFQNSIMSGKSADEVIEDIMNHIVVKEEEPAPVENSANEELDEAEEAEEPAPEVIDNEEDVKVSDTLFTLFSSKGE